MSEHVHDCDGKVCNNYTVCSEERCKEPQQAPCWTCSQDRIRWFDDQLQGQGTGLTALAMLLGHPEDGLVEAVKRLIAERDKYKQLHSMEAEARKATREAMAAEADRTIAGLQRRVEAMDTEHRAWHKMADKAIEAQAERDAMREERDALRSILTEIYEGQPAACVGPVATANPVPCKTCIWCRVRAVLYHSLRDLT